VTAHFGGDGFPAEFKGDSEHVNDGYFAQFFTDQSGLAERAHERRFDMQHIRRGLDI
jgi:hypothetical protein